MLTLHGENTFVKVTELLSTLKSSSGKYLTCIGSFSYPKSELSNTAVLLNTAYVTTTSRHVKIPDMICGTV